MSKDLSLYKDIVFSTDDEIVAVACEIWRYHEGRYKKFIDIKPYYKYEIDYSVLSKSEQKALEDMNLMGTIKSNIGTTLKKVGKLTKTVGNFVLGSSGYGSDNTLLGLQIDKSSRFGTKIEISFSDYQRLLYRLIKTNDIMYLWVVKIPKSLTSQAIAPTSVPIPLFNLAKFYSQKRFQVDMVDYYDDKIKVSVGSNLLKYGNLIDELCFAGKYYIRDRVINPNYKEVPHFAGFITVKNYHLARTAQLRMSGMDPARMFQHLKIDYGFEDDEEGTKYDVNEYNKNFFWETCKKAFYKCIDLGLAIEEETNNYFVIPEDFFRVLSQTVYENSINIEKDYGRPYNYLLISFDYNIRKYIDSVSISKSRIKFKKIPASDDNNGSLQIQLDLNQDDYPSNYALAEALTQPISKFTSFTSERFNPDAIDLFTQPRLFASRNTPSLIDFIISWISRLFNNTQKVMGNIRKNVWVSSNVFIKDKGIVLTLLFTYSGKDWYSGKIKNSGYTHEIYLDEIAELDIYEINRRGNVSSCELYDDYINPLNVSCILKNPSVRAHHSDGQLRGKVTSISSKKDLITYKNGNIIYSNEVENLKLQVNDLYNAITNITTKEEEDSGKVNMFEQLKYKVREAGGSFKDIQILFNFNEGFHICWNNNDKDNWISFKLPNSPIRFTIPTIPMTLHDFSIYAKSFFDCLDNICKNFFELTSAKFYEERGITRDYFMFINPFREDALRNSLSHRKKIFRLFLEATKKTNPITALSVSIEERNARITRILEEDKNKYTQIITKYGDDLKRGSFINSIAVLKRNAIQIVLDIIRLGIETIGIMINDLIAMEGRNGSIYMPSAIDIQVGDEIILFEESRGRAIEHLSRKLRYARPDGGIEYKTKISQLIGNTITSKGRLADWISGGVIKVNRDFIENGEGKIFFEDGINISDLKSLKIPKEDIPRWFVYRHIIYAGNFGITSGFMSKIYITDNPLLSNIPFDEDNVVTRELSTFLQRAGLSEHASISTRRLLG